MSVNNVILKQTGLKIKTVCMSAFMAGLLLSTSGTYAIAAEQQTVTVSNAPSATLPATTNNNVPAVTPAPAMAKNQSQPSVSPGAPGDTLSLATFTPQSLYQHADNVVKTVILILLFASVFSWSTWLGKTLNLWSRSRQMKHNLSILIEKKSLRQDAALTSKTCLALHDIAIKELKQVQLPVSQYSASSLQERVHARMQRVEVAKSRQATCGASILATTSAVTPFIGLFGTVWGIMHSFMSIAQSHTTNLSVVAPGIAEALFATALGLVVAIPAVILYNILSRQITSYRRLLADAVTYTLCLLSHDLDSLAKENSVHFTSAA